MTEEGRKYLSDIILAIERIEQFVEGISDFYSYDKDLKTQSAVERQLVIIGEALGQLKKVESNLQVKNDQKIIGFRNRLVHGYDKIDNSIVWAILQKHLPQLKAEIKNIKTGR